MARDCHSRAAKAPPGSRHFRSAIRRRPAALATAARRMVRRLGPSSRRRGFWNLDEQEALATVEGALLEAAPASAGWAVDVRCVMTPGLHEFYFYMGNSKTLSSAWPPSRWWQRGMGTRAKTSLTAFGIWLAAQGAPDPEGASSITPLCTIPLPCANMLKRTYCLMAPRPIPPRSPLKPVEWIGSARADLRDMPGEVQDEFGYALHEAQRGKHHPSAKKLKGDLRGLIELVDDFDGDTYRAIYTGSSPASSTCCTSFRRRPHAASPPRNGRSR